MINNQPATPAQQISTQGLFARSSAQRVASSSSDDRFDCKMRMLSGIVLGLCCLSLASQDNPPEVASRNVFVFCSTVGFLIAIMAAYEVGQYSNHAEVEHEEQNELGSVENRMN